MILIYDTETTSLVMDRLSHDHPSQPDLVQLGLLLCDVDGTERASVELIVKPPPQGIPISASQIHGVTTEVAERCGVPLVMAVATFQRLADLADTVVAHNLPFDERVMATAMFRANRKNDGKAVLKRVCTAELAEDVVRIPATARMKAAGFGHKHKKPSLSECYRYFFREELVGAHSALIDAKACARIYFQVVLRGGMRRERTTIERLLPWLRLR